MNRKNRPTMNLKLTIRQSLVVIVSFLFLTACGGGDESKDEKGKDDEKEKEKEETIKTYSYDHSKTALSITTYKHTAKNGVGIDFDSLSVDGVGSKSEKLADLFEGASFEVPISEMNSGDPDRDDKIREHFFGSMESSSVLSGKVEEMEMDGKKGSALLSIEMNGNKEEVEMDAQLKEEELSMTGDIDVLNWDGNDALDALEEACEEKHTGEDGKTKLWPEVNLNVSTELKVRERLAEE